MSVLEVRETPDPLTHSGRGGANSEVNCACEGSLESSRRGLWGEEGGGRDWGVAEEGLELQSATRSRQSSDVGDALCLSFP